MPDWKLLPSDERVRAVRLSQRNYLEGNLLSKVMTPFEHKTIGGTADNQAFIERRGRRIDDMHTPIVVLGFGSPKGKVSVEEVGLIRNALGFRIIPTQYLGLVQNFVTGEVNEELKGKLLAVSLEPLNPKTGVTTRDPRILGIWDPVKKEIEQGEGEKLTKDWYIVEKQLADRFPEEDTTWKYTRDGKSYLETEISGEPEKG